MKMPDTEGYIPEAPTGDIAPPFRAVVTAVINGLTQRQGDLIHSLYLYGSVAQGTAKVGVSDLDICIILSRPASEAERQALEAVRRETEATHQAVSKIDFDIGTLSVALHPNHLYSWGYWLKHHCRCLYGDDLARRFPPFRPSRKIAQAINGDVVAVLQSYIRQLAAMDSLPARRPLQRAAARKLIRATNLLRSDEERDWPDTLEAHAARFLARYPARAEEIGYFLRESYHPEDDAGRFVARLETFMAWLADASRDDPPA